MLANLTFAEKFIYSYFVITFIAAVVFVFAATPREFGKIDQGRVIAYDNEKRVVTIISDAKEDPEDPDYSILPPREYQMPDPRWTGPEPKAGGLMKLDTEKNEIIIFDEATQNFKTIPYTLIEQKEAVGTEDPLVYDKVKRKAKEFPVVDREKKTITIYSEKLEILTTFTLPDEYFALPDSIWDMGDEVRIYYREEGKARRFMNITKTDIYGR